MTGKMSMNRLKTIPRKKELPDAEDMLEDAATLRLESPCKASGRFAVYTAPKEATPIIDPRYLILTVDCQGSV
jgi:hypothetical protein